MERLIYMLICCAWSTKSPTNIISKIINATNPIFVAVLIVINSCYVIYYMPLLCTKLIMGAYFSENVKDAHYGRLAVPNKKERLLALPLLRTERATLTALRSSLP